jgi:membrane associated rhomboid family serine protease
MGAARFALFYLLCGLAASFAHIVFGSGSNIPAVGASGAISGVLGGYLMLFPRNRVRVLVRGGVAQVPALVVLGFWIVIQMVNGIGSMANTTESAGVAYMAHIGGFVAGLVLVKLMASPRQAGSFA